MQVSYNIIFAVLLIPFCYGGNESTSRYQIKRKIFSVGTGFEVKNEQGNDIFNVQGEFFSFGKKFALEDMNGK
uniref:Uncharacterized protein n=1 Tax=Panagrolaimus sp. PS1159 TaxID=55785 RepID=A0AC35GTJ2_9BILA